MTEVPVTDAVRVLIPGRYDHCPPNRFFISRQDALLLMCSQCGGRVNTIHHVILGDSMLPMISPCTCKENRG
jgi:hypothetical protein